MKSLVNVRAAPLALAVIFGLLLALIPLPAPAFSVPRTLAHSHRLGALDGRSEPIRAAFDLEYVGVIWRGGGEPEIRFLGGSGWGPWRHVHHDELSGINGRSASTLIPATGAAAFQLRGHAKHVRTVAINTTDGPRSVTWELLGAHASHIAQPAVISRALWGADESYRFDTSGKEIWPPAFYATKKLIVHHTGTANADPDPAATVRAIYRYHAVDLAYGDIGYNFLVDANGNVYKGRYSGPPGTGYEDTPTGENASGLGVSAAHTGGWNSGTMGIAILGTYTSTPVPSPARSTLVEHLAWESERHGLDPLATTTFTNPVSGAQKTTPNISGHRDWTATECPGGLLYQDLPAIRQEVASRLGTAPPPPPPADTQPPTFSSVNASSITRTSAVIGWTTNEPATSSVEYWPRGSSAHSWTPLDPALVAQHSVSLSGLTRGTRYRYRSLSSDAAGNAAASATYSFRTAS